jgi:hypothetical protein
MEQRADVQRTVRTMGSNGLETFTTMHIETLHFESHLMSTNCGPLGVRSKDEPGTDRQALTDRSFAQTVKSASHADSKKSDGEFDLEKASIEVKDQVNRIRVVSCLMAYGLVFIKHLPHCEPNITYARELTDKWDTILYDEFNLPPPSKRKKIKRKMLFHLFAMESAVVEKFVWKHTGMDYKDMLPDENGMLSGFCIDQMVDVIRSLQRCLDHETILNAWSHNLAHSAPTASHTLELKTVLAQLHGEELDNRTLTGALPPAPPQKRGQKRKTPADAAAPAAPAAPAAKRPAATPAGGRGNDETSLRADQADLDAVLGEAPPVDAGAAQFGDLASAPVEGADNANAEAAAERAAEAAEAMAGVDFSEENAHGQQAEARAAAMRAANAERADVEEDDAGSRNSVPLETPLSSQGTPVCDVLQIKGLMQDGMTRRDCVRLAKQLEQQRQLRADYSGRLMTRNAGSNASQKDHTVLDEVAAAMTDSTNAQGEPVHEHSSTGIKIDAKSAAAAIMPTVKDVLASGIDDQFLRDILQGRTSTHFGNKGEFYHLLGLKRNMAWEYEMVNSGTKTGEAAKPAGGDGGTAAATANRLATPAEYDFNWAIHKSFTTNKALNGSGDSAKKTIWTNAATMIEMASKNASSDFFSLVKVDNMTMETIRDTLYQMQLPAPEYQVRIPTFNHQRAKILDQKRMLHNTRTITEGTIPREIHPQGMFVHRSDTQITSAPVMTTAYAKPAPMKRPFALVDETGYQSRLDHLNCELALPVAAMPVNFTRGVFVKEARNHNGIYFNKWIAREHTNFVIEASAFLSRVPGVAGGNFPHTPDSFVDPSLLSKKKARQHQVQEAPAKAASSAEAAAPQHARDDDPMPTGNLSDEEDQRRDGIDEDTAESSGEEGFIADDDVTEKDAEIVDKAKGVSADHNLTDQPVREAGAPTAAPSVAQPGAAKVAASMSVEEDARIPSMPYDWDMLQMFLTCKMAETLHHDVKEYVANMRSHYKDVFTEEASETLRDLPQMSLRFPGFGNDPDALAVLEPLSVKLSLEQPEGRYEDLGRKRKRQDDDVSDMAKAAAHSLINGRLLSHDDPAVRAFEAEQRGGGGSCSLKGNLFARSSWLHFTLAQLDGRGMLTDAEMERTHDQGVCLRQRIAHSKSVHGDATMRKYLKERVDLPCDSFEARERKMRETGVDENARKKRTWQQVDQDYDEELGLAQTFKKPTIGSGAAD